LEVRFGVHPVDFIVALSIGAFSRILVDLVDFAGRLLGRLLCRLLSVCLVRLPPGALLASR